MRGWANEALDSIVYENPEFIVISTPTVVVIGYESCCPTPIEGQLTYEQFRASYTKVICPPDGGSGGICNPIASKPYEIYSYYRNAQIMAWSNLATVTRSADVYFRASNPAKPANQPDNEDFFQNELRKTYAFYTTRTGSGQSFEVTDFHKNTRPWRSDTLEVKSWQLNGAAVLLKWDFEYK